MNPDTAVALALLPATALFWAYGAHRIRTTNRKDRP